MKTYFRIPQKKKNNLSSIIVSLKYFSKTKHTYEEIQKILDEKYDIVLSIPGIRRYVTEYNKKNLTQDSTRVII